MSAVKRDAKKLIERLPESATWDDVIYEFYVKKKISSALKAAKEGRIIPHERVKEKLLRR